MNKFAGHGVVHVFNPSNWEAEADRPLSSDQPGVHNELQNQKQNINKQDINNFLLGSLLFFLSKSLVQTYLLLICLSLWGWGLAQI